MSQIKDSSSLMSNFISWARSNSIWVYVINLSGCCSEMSTCFGPRYDWERFGSILKQRPEDADLLLISGTATENNKAILKNVYSKLRDPKYVISVGSCANTGGVFVEKSYAVHGGINKYVPVDIFVPGCPPRAESVIDGLMSLQLKIQKRSSDGR